ncbi:hypothetical protein ACHAXS_002612, partial [Conticribra weissflogii]
HDATSDHAIRDSNSKQPGGNCCNDSDHLSTNLAANNDHLYAESFHENHHNPHVPRRRRHLSSLVMNNGTSSAPRNHDRSITQRTHSGVLSTQTLPQCNHSRQEELHHAIRQNENSLTSNHHKESPFNAMSEKTAFSCYNEIHGKLGSEGRTEYPHRWKNTLFLSATLAFGMSLSILPFISVIYTLDFQHNIFLLERNERDIQIQEKYTAILQHREKISNHWEQRFQSAQDKLKQSQQHTVNLRNELSEAEQLHHRRMSECHTVVEEHQHTLKETQDRLAALRSEKQGSALDMAWLRIDEMMEENHGLSNQLKQYKKERKILTLQLQTRDVSEARKLQKEKEQLYKIDSLTEKNQMAEEEKEQLQKQLRNDRDEIASIRVDHDYLQFTYTQTMNSFFAPILQYVQNLQRTSERQHSLILELTSLVHSLQTSLELKRAYAETQSIESIHAVSAIASAANEIARAKEEKYILEKENYMDYMKRRLDRLEEEAFGAVQAVAEAAGKMEFERKRDEDLWWKGYVEEVERVLGEISVEAEEELVGGSSNGDEESSGVGTVGNKNLGMVETSVLRAAISRRVEAGIVSLRQLIHPNYYFFGIVNDSLDE